MTHRRSGIFSPSFSSNSNSSDSRKDEQSCQLRFEQLELRMLLAVTTVISGGGDWHAPDTWDNGVPTMAVDAVVPVGNTVWLSGVTHEAKSLLVEGAASAVQGRPANDERRVVQPGSRGHAQTILR